MVDHVEPVNMHVGVKLKCERAGNHGGQLC